MVFSRSARKISVNRMDSARSIAQCSIEANFHAERVDDGIAAESISLTTASDGTLIIHSTGRVPRGTLRQLRQARKALMVVAKTTGQCIRVQHNGQQLAQLQPRVAKDAKWSIRWWSVLKCWIRG